MSASFHADSRSAVAAGSLMGPHAAPPLFGADEALRAAHRVAVLLRSGAAPTSFAPSGLGALNVPRAHNGPELSFEVIARVVRIIAEADRSAGEAIRHHLAFVAAIGCFAGRDQRTELYSLALRGLRFGRSLFGPGNTPLRLLRREGGLAIEGPLGPGPARETLPPHLLPIRVRDDRNRHWHAIADADAVWAGRRDPSALPPVAHDRLMALETGPGLDGEQPMEAIRLLLRASMDTGLAGRALGDRINRLRRDAAATGRAVDRDAVEAVGGLRLRLDAAIAVLEKAGRTVDRALIRPTASSVALAQVSASGARILAAELAQQAGVAPPEASPDHRRGGGGRIDPVRSRYALLGAFYLDGTAPAGSS